MELQHRKANKNTMVPEPDNEYRLGTQPQRRWNLACNTVYFIVSLSHKVLHSNNLLPRVTRFTSYISLDITVDENNDHNMPFPFTIDQKSLASLTRERNLEFVSQFGGVKHLALALETNPSLGVSTKVEDITVRKEAFGSNVYQKPPKKTVISFVFEAFEDVTIIILLFCAVISLGFGIKQHGPKEGWYDGGSIIIAVFLVVSVSVISNFKQSRQFEKLSKESSDIQVEALRDGRRQHISIFEVVVGEIIFLKIGDQVPADGLFLDGHSLKVDESSMTGESDHVDIDVANNPFLTSGTKVTDGYGRMVVTSVGANTLVNWQGRPTGCFTCSYCAAVALLHLLGIVGLKDPCRPGVREAVEICRKAGVNVKMVTGDNIFTAKAIAIECGILEKDDGLHDEAVLEGIKFRNFSQEERMQKIDHIQVMARSSPFDKLLMVQCLKQKGHVVAVTGDGTNDAPALKEADIGLSMGIQGTEVAKESSDIVILDDNFASIVTVLRWGRCVYNNIQKFIQFQLTVNIAALTINFIASVSSGNVPLTAVQLLWVNLIMDTLGALALATEQPTEDLMTKAPVGRVEPLITKVMWRNLIAQALYQIAIMLTLQFKGTSIFGVDDRIKNTLIFNCFVLCQVFNEFNARKLEQRNIFEGVLKNRLFIGIVGITVVLQVVMVELLKKFAGTERLNWGQWGACIVVAAITWPIGLLVKCIPTFNMHHSFNPS